MYGTFDFSDKNVKIIGYQWIPENPEHVVCLVHGIGECAARYDRIGEFFNKAGIALISMDLRGHGLSAGKRGHTAPRREIFYDIDRLIQYTAGKYEELPLILYGHSMGGNIVLDYRRKGKNRDRISGYVITSPWILLSKKIPDYLYITVKLLSKIKPDFLINTNIKNEDLGNKEIISNLNRNQLMHGKISVLTAIESFEIGKELMASPLLISNLQSDTEKRKPLLLMHGNADKVCSVEGSRKIAEVEDKQCKYIEWEGLLHEIHNGNEQDDGREVIMTMINWIRQF